MPRRESTPGKAASQSLFNRFGRFNFRQPPDMEKVSTDSLPGLRIAQPRLQYAERLRLLHLALGMVKPIITEEAFAKRCATVIARIRKDSRLRNLLKGPHFPIVIPHLGIAVDDLGKLFREWLLPSVRRAHVAQFLDRRFEDFTSGERGRPDEDLSNKIQVVEGTRHDQLIKVARDEPVVGIYFAMPFVGLSVWVQRQVIKILPDDLILSGLDIPFAMMAYPDVLARGGRVPRLHLSALSAEMKVEPSYKVAPCFMPEEYRLCFAGMRIDDVQGAYCGSGGLFVLG